MLHHEESPEKPEYNVATTPFLDTPPPHFALLPPFLAKNFKSPHFHQFWKRQPPNHPAPPPPPPLELCDYVISIKIILLVVMDIN